MYYHIMLINKYVNFLEQPENKQNNQNQYLQ